jgi:hypothetical protein
MCPDFAFFNTSSAGIKAQLVATITMRAVVRNGTPAKCEAFAAAAILMMRRRSAPLVRLAAKGMLHNAATSPKKIPDCDRAAGSPMPMTISNIAENVERNTRRALGIPSRQNSPNRRVWYDPIQKTVAVRKSLLPRRTSRMLLKRRGLCTHPISCNELWANSDNRD